LAHLKPFVSFQIVSEFNLMPRCCIFRLWS